MDHRQRLAAALAHQQPDRVPIDFGSTAVTGIHVSVVAGLREHYGLDRHPVRVVEPYQMLGKIEPDLAVVMGIDTVGVLPRGTLLGFANTDWKPWRTPWGQEVLMGGGFTCTTGADGSIYSHPDKDATVPPSAHLPAGGYFFDTIIRQRPIDEDRLDPADNCEEFSDLVLQDLDHFRLSVAAAAATGRAVVATFGGTALGDIALVPGPFMSDPRGIRDIQEWYISTSTRQELVHAIFEHQTQVALRNLRRIHDVIEPVVQAVFTCGTDFGTQRGPFCSTRAFASLWAPYYRRINAWIHTNTSWKVLKHSCGGVRPFLHPFVDCGMDVLNPVQCSATGMDAAQLKQEIGDRLVFWGGGVDTQQVLPFGSPAQVREQVLSRCETFAPGGGFVFNAIHNIQACTPIANVIAMVDAVHHFNGRR
jgi:hypothetical protein